MRSKSFKAVAAATVVLLANIGACDARARPSAAAIPLAMLGTWGTSAETCAKDRDDGQLIVKPKSVEFFASSYDVKTIVVRRDGAIRIHAVIHEEGEPGTSRGTVELKLAAADRISAWTDAAGTSIYVRCATRRIKTDGK